MRIERFTDGWLVYTEPGELGTEDERYLGAITPRGPIRLGTGWGRGERRRRAENLLGDARMELLRRGEIRDAGYERRRREELVNGSFVVELDNGEMRRFYSFRSETTGEDARSSALYRPGAIDWADDALRSGAATHADVVRVMGERQRIYEPRILPAREEHPQLVIGDGAHLPTHSMTTRLSSSGAVSLTMAQDVARAYRLKHDAMRMVDTRFLDRDNPAEPPQIADAWDVAMDAFIVAGLPLQEDFARENAEFWRARSGVSSRLRATPRGSALRRRTR